MTRYANEPRRLLRGMVLFGAGAATAAALLIAVQAATAVPRSYSPYRKLSLFAKVLTQIENNYVTHVDDKKLIHGAIRGMLSALDPHSVFMPPDQYRQLKAETQGEFGGLGIEVEIRDQVLTIISPIEGTPAHRAGIKSGDQIVKVDGRSTRGLQMDEAVQALRGPRGSRVRLEVRRADRKQPLVFELVRDVIKIVSVSHRKLSPSTGYIRIKTFQERTARSVRQALDELRNDGALGGLVVDLRNNPGGLLAEGVAVADLFIGSGLIVRTTGKSERVMDQERARGRGTFSGFPIVCLVNGGSASASEIVAGALQDHRRAVVLGTPTFGKGSVQTIIELGDGSGLKLTVARYYTPKGRSIQEHGIEPDIIVQARAPRTISDKTQREKDLAGHLPPAPDKSKSARRRLDDFQLQTALDYLRAARIFSSR